MRISAENGGQVRTHQYQITIRGGLGETYRQAFDGFGVESDATDTVLTADLDQVALHGALNRIHSLGLELVELNRLDHRGD